ncbi:hypothetical protein SteCoe_31810 [Stentor coeruleus]|uniref:Uncharacterized protein n=1 Tax=Stentor coeruleus TaxID=5963 RepID=A0A1R2B0W3_9CILI|nr:hypothetical protein SteCoe_31810 [Stentor coeruleus]
MKNLITNPIPHPIPRPDSPSTLGYEAYEDIINTKIPHDDEWQEIKSEFYRLKENEFQTKIFQTTLAEELSLRKMQLEELYYYTQVLYKKTKDQKSVISQLKQELKSSQSELSEKSIQIQHMLISREQMHELFIEKEIETEKLKKKNEELQMEISQYKMLETTKYSENELSLQRSSFVMSKSAECDNFKYFLSLLSSSQGILYKNRNIEVGICLKIDQGRCRAILYIGNRKETPLINLETYIESEDLPGEINTKIEPSPVLHMQQANRIMHFDYSKGFTISPKLIIKYNDMNKILLLPITQALLCNKTTEDLVRVLWKKFSNSSMVFCQQNEGFILDDLIGRLKLYPNFEVWNKGEYAYVYTAEFLMRVMVNENELEVETRGDFKVCGGLNEIVKCLLEQIN